MPQPGNPQSLNRYSYSYSNPLRYTDPSGHCATDGNTAKGCPQWMPDLVFGALELVADLTVSKPAFAPAEDAQPDDLASLTEAADARWYQGAALSMVDAYDLADTMDECASGRCSSARVALGGVPPWRRIMHRCMRGSMIRGT